MKKLYLLIAFLIIAGVGFVNAQEEDIIRSNTASNAGGTTLQQLKSLSSRTGTDTIYYDDGTNSEHWHGVSYWAVRFTPPQPDTVKTALINIYEAGSTSCTVSIAPDNGGSPGTADETVNFTAQEGWNAINFTSPHFYNGDFWIIFDVPTSDSGPMVSGDGAGVGRSYYSTNDTSWTQYSGSDWAIRAVGDYAIFNHDVKTLSVSPTGYVKPVTPLTPTAIVMNNGLQDDSFSVICNIGTSYSDTVNLGTVGAGVTDTVKFAAFTPDSGYAADMTVYTNLQSDENTSNDTLSAWFYAYWFHRQGVMLQNFTYTECAYCPYQAKAIHQLKDEVGDSLVPAEHHVWDTNDPFRLAVNDTIAGWYGVSGTPTSMIDGIIEVGGGYTGVYDTIRAAYEKRDSVPSPVEIADTGSFTGPNQLRLITNVINHGDIPSTWDLRLKYILRETNIPYKWETEDSIYWAVRTIQPNIGGVPFANAVVDTQTFTIDSSWDINKCYIAVYVQDQNTKEIFQAKEIKVSDFMGIKTNCNPETKENRAKISFIKGKLRVNIGGTPNGAKLTVYDLIGRRLMNEKLRKGENLIALKGSVKRNGVYFVRVTEKNDVLGMKKIIFIK